MHNSCCKSSPSTESFDGGESAVDSIRFIGIRNEIKAGTAFLICVQTLPLGDRFVIDFYSDNENKDIALRLDVRFSTNSLTRNSRIKSEWGLAEVDVPPNFRLVNVKNFELQVFFKVDGIAIAFDNRHVANYKHRLAFGLIRSILTRGAFINVLVQDKLIVSYSEQRVHIPHATRVHDRNIEMQEVENPPSVAMGGKLGGDGMKYLPLPYNSPFNNSFFETGRLNVIGKVSHSPKMIKFTLQIGCRNSPPTTTAIQLEVRFTEKRAAGSDEPLIVLKSFRRGKWKGEVECQSENGLQPGGDFNLLVKRGAKSHKFYMNKKYIFNYPNFIDAKVMARCCVDGDIQLISVVN